MTRTPLSTALGTTLGLGLAALLAACGGERAPAPGSADATVDAPPPPMDQPAEDVPPATAPPATTPGTGAPDGDGDLARFGGYGDIDFGTAEADMEKAWGGELAVLGKEFSADCYFMTPKWVDTPAEFNFMIGEGKFVRVGTESDRFAAPGGGKVGMTKAEIAGLYAGRVEEQPHKYTDGEYLRIKDDASGSALVFETDGKADDAKVTEWRAGTPPHVDYVEGCS